MINDLHCPVPDVVHSLHPQHLILRFELFSYALSLGHLLCQQEHLLRYLFVDVGKVGIQLAADQQFRVQGFALLLDMPQVALPPNPDGPFFLSRYCQAWDVIVALKLIPKTIVLIIKTIVLIINVLFHIDILRYNSR